MVVALCKSFATRSRQITVPALNFLQSRYCSGHPTNWSRNVNALPEVNVGRGCVVVVAVI